MCLDCTSQVLARAGDSLGMCPAPSHSVCAWKLSFAFSSACLWVRRGRSLSWLEAQGCISIALLAGGTDTLPLYPVATQAFAGSQQRVLYHIDGLLHFKNCICDVFNSLWSPRSFVFYIVKTTFISCVLTFQPQLSKYVWVSALNPGGSLRFGASP